MAKEINKINFFSRTDNTDASVWQEKIEAWLKENFPNVEVTTENPEAVLVLGGDGTIMEAARKYANDDVIILGINLGWLGFLASINDPKDFDTELTKFINGDFHLNSGMVISAEVIREDKKVFSAHSFNEIAVQNPLGMVDVGVSIEGEMVQEVKGTGILVSTPAGSTAYNLSAHGPILAPNIECFVITELFDHSLPTPSLVVPSTEVVTLFIQNFREHKLLKLSSTGEELDVLLTSDGAKPFVLKKGDKIEISRAKSSFKMAMLEKSSFYKNLKSKFSFK
jgi:NAD+ kinase